MEDGPGRIAPISRPDPVLVAYIRYMYIPSSGELRFEWDPAKAAQNVRKHGVSVLEAQTSFSDDYGLLVDELGPASEEQRFVLLGVSSAVRLLVVVHSYREIERTIRLISARKATRSERAQYAAQFRK